MANRTFKHLFFAEPQFLHTWSYKHDITLKLSLDNRITSRYKNVQRFLHINVQKLRLKWEICFCNKTSKTVAREMVFGVNYLNPSRNHPMVWFLENVLFLRLNGDFLPIIVVLLLIKESNWEMFCSKGLPIGKMKLR